MSDEEEYVSCTKSLPEGQDKSVSTLQSPVPSVPTTSTSLGSSLSEDSEKCLQFEQQEETEEDKEGKIFQDVLEIVEMAPKLFTRKTVVETIPSTRGHSREYLFKILVIGELATGKTSFIKRYVHQFFSDHYRATIGVDFALKVVNWDENTLIRLQLWDIAGQERFGNMTRVYYKEAVGAFIVFDVSRPGTFEAVTKWKNDLDSKVSLPDGSPVPAILLANKSDMKKEGTAANPKMLDNFCAEIGFSGWYYTSAKDNLNVEESARFLISKILQSRKAFEGEDDDTNERDQVLTLHHQTSDRTENRCSC